MPVRGGQVRLAVAVEIADRNRERREADREAGGGFEADARAQQHADGIAAWLAAAVGVVAGGVGGYEIRAVIAIEVANRDTLGDLTGAVIGGTAEGAFAVAQQHA